MESEGTPLIRRSPSRWNCVICLLVTLLIVLVAMLAAVVLVAWLIHVNNNDHPRSNVGHYQHAAVATDNPECSRVGRKILQENGTVVDSAIATLLCLGLHDACSCGLGGGDFYMIYAKPTDGSSDRREVFALDARETAPSNATKTMLDNKPYGPLTIGVPGAVSGYHAAWKRFGRLPWERLFKPAIHMANNGFKVSWKLAHYISTLKLYIQKSPYLREVFLKHDGSVYKEGDIIKMPKLGRTLHIISHEGPKAFYSRSLSEDIETELKNAGSIITKKDLSAYKSEWRNPVQMQLQGHKFYTMPPPSGAAALLFMLNILAGYNLTSSDVKTVDSAVLTYHRFTEAMKFGYAKKSFLGDPSFIDVKDMLKDLTSRKYSDEIRRKINDSKTYDPQYYGSNYTVKEQGTSHFSILGPDGSAVAVTSTINAPFGSGIRGNVTGILYNNEMLDFSIEMKNETYTPPPLNDIQPGKKPLSSMSPTIFLDAKTDDVVGVIGGSGGSHIPSGILRVLTNKLWFGEDLKTADDAARLHHSLVPDILVVEKEISRPIIDGLKKTGHNVQVTDDIGSGIQAIWSSCRRHTKDASDIKCITAVSDKRLGGKPDGY